LSANQLDWPALHQMNMTSRRYRLKGLLPTNCTGIKNSSMQGELVQQMRQSVHEILIDTNGAYYDTFGCHAYQAEM
jgi:hypothetical protein